MRIISRFPVLASAVLAAAAFTTITASAATVRVPFNFTVAGKAMPAGQYSVDRTGLSNFVRLGAPDTEQSFTWTLMPGDPAPGSSDVKVYFNKTGSSYELRSIQYHALTTGRLDKTKHRGDSTVRVLRGE
jgi:hypothetical protein